MANINKITSGNPVDKHVVTVKNHGKTNFIASQRKGTLDFTAISTKYDNTFKHQQPPYSG